MWETWVRSLGWEDPLEKEMATHSSILAWEIPWTDDPGRLQSMGSERVRHNWVTWLSFFQNGISFAKWAATCPHQIVVPHATRNWKWGTARFKERFPDSNCGIWASQMAPAVKHSPANAGDVRDPCWSPGPGTLHCRRAPEFTPVCFPGGSDSKEPTCKVGDLGLIPGLGRFS